jgi:hypothetical protein
MSNQTRKFEVKPGPHAPQLAIQAHDLTKDECEALRWIIVNNHIESEDYKMSRGAAPFLQGYQPPYNRLSAGGWVLVEFWSDDRKAIDRFVDYINQIFAERVARCAQMDQ